MAEFAVHITRVEGLSPIEGADRIEAAQIGGYQSIVAKGAYKIGDLVAYIPEQAILPDSLIEEMGLVGKLAGASKNRVKAIKLKGVLSQGLVYPSSRILERKLETASWSSVDEGEDVASLLGIVKYEPEIPAQFRGQLSRPRGNYNLINFDIENIKKYPRMFVPGEEVAYTEKIHGTFMQAWYWGETGDFAVSSKGLGARGFIIEDTEPNKDNTYVRAASKFALGTKAAALFNMLRSDNPNVTAVSILGEVFGQGIQDMGYASQLQFRVFDIYVVSRDAERGFESGRYMNFFEYRLYAEEFLGLECVPLLYVGPYTLESLAEHTNGTETVSGNEQHIREGVVIRPLEERDNRGRVIAKSVSEAYLLRKGNATEYN